MKLSSHFYFNGIILILAFLFVHTASTFACTGMRVVAKDGSVIFARSLEFGYATASDIMISPRGIKWTASAPNGNKGFEWTSKYAFMGPNAFGENSPLEGMNEKGLYAGGFWMTSGSSEYPTVSPEDYPKTISQIDLCTWILTNCATINDVKAGLSKLKLTGVVLESANMVTLVHWYVMDASGKAITIEAIDGNVIITDNPIGVITNAPSFDWHLTNLRAYINCSAKNIESSRIGDYKVTPTGEGTGLLGIPGDFTPPSRFIRAALFSNMANPVEDANEAITLGMNLIANFSIPKGVIKGGNNEKQECDYTQWTTVYNLAQKQIYFRTYENQNYKLVDMKELPIDGDKIVFVKMHYEAEYEDVSNSIYK